MLVSNPSSEVMDKMVDLSTVSFFICKVRIIIALCVLIEQIEITRTTAQRGGVGTHKCPFFLLSLSYFRLPLLRFPWTTHYFYLDRLFKTHWVICPIVFNLMEIIVRPNNSTYLTGSL